MLLCYFAVYDASGQYTANVLFGSEYWLGSLNACLDLQLKKYYVHTPPFPATFYIAKINLTLDTDHLPHVSIFKFSVISKPYIKHILL